MVSVPAGVADCWTETDPAELVRPESGSATGRGPPAGEDAGTCAEQMDAAAASTQNRPARAARGVNTLTR